MSEYVAISAASDEDPSDTPMSNCPTPLNILVKIERIESDNEESREIESYVPMTWISKGTIVQRELQVKLTPLPLFILKHFIDNTNRINSNGATTDTSQQVKETDKSKPEQLSYSEPDFQSKFKIAFSRLLPSSFQHKPVIKEGSLSTNKLKLKTNGSSQTHQIVAAERDLPNAHRKENNYQENNINLECQSKKIQAKEYPCTMCKYVTTIESVHKKHLKAHSAKYQYVCEICSYIAARKYALLCHLSIHTGEKPYTCDICHRKFTFRNVLYRHLRTHSSKKPHACKICHKKFKLHRYLKVHAKVHTGERPHACEMCDKKFALRLNLRLHMRTHTGEKPYACGICNKKFAFHGVLKNHMRTHTGERPYACKICGKTIADRGNFTKHLQAHVGKNYYLYLKQERSD